MNCTEKKVVLELQHCKGRYLVFFLWAVCMLVLPSHVGMFMVCMCMLVSFARGCTDGLSILIAFILITLVSTACCYR